MNKKPISSRPWIEYKLSNIFGKREYVSGIFYQCRGSCTLTQRRSLFSLVLWGVLYRTAYIFPLSSGCLKRLLRSCAPDPQKHFESVLTFTSLCSRPKKLRLPSAGDCAQVDAGHCAAVAYCSACRATSAYCPWWMAGTTTERRARARSSGDSHRSCRRPADNRSREGLSRHSTPSSADSGTCWPFCRRNAGGCSCFRWCWPPAGTAAADGRRQYPPATTQSPEHPSLPAGAPTSQPHRARWAQPSHTPQNLYNITGVAP